MKYFDTHTHILKEYYTPEEREKLMKDAFEGGMEYILIPGTSEKDTLEIMNYKTDRVLIAAGVHPDAAHDISVLDFYNDLDMSLFSAIGEVGLDTYHETNPPIEQQIIVFKKQIEIAKENNIPVIIHNRETSQQVFDIISSDEYKDMTFILHSFAQGPKEAELFLPLNVYFSFSGIVTFKNAQSIRDALLLVPNDRILAETDAPYLTPAPNRGKKNLPEYTKHIVAKIAEVKEMNEEEMANIIFENSKRVFKL